MFDYVTYRSWKTTTVIPTNATYTKEIFTRTAMGSSVTLYSADGTGVRLNTDADPPVTEEFYQFVNQNGTREGYGTTRITQLGGFYSREISTEFKKQTAGNLWQSTFEDGVGNTFRRTEDESAELSGGITNFSSQNQNSWTTSFSQFGGQAASSSGLTSSSSPLQKVTQQTTTQSTYTRSLRTTSSTSFNSRFYTTTVPEGATRAVTTDSTRSATSVRSSSTQTTLSRTQSTTNGTEEFVTYAEWSAHQIVVADTIILTVSAERTGAGSLAVLQTQTGTENFAINNLPYLTQNTTINWVPALTISTRPTTEPFTTTIAEIITSAFLFSDSGGIVGTNGGFTIAPETKGHRFASSTTQTREITTTSFTSSQAQALTVSFATFTCEDWVTFTTESTTTNTSTSGTISTTSVSLNTGYTYEEQDDEGNLVSGIVVPQGGSFQTGLTTFEQFITTQTDTTLTETVWEDGFSTTESLSPRLGGFQGGLQITTPQLGILTEVLGVRVRTHELPWKTENGFAVIQASSLESSTSISSSKSITTRAIVFYETEYSRLDQSSNSHESTWTAPGGGGQSLVSATYEEEQNQSLTSTGTIFATAENSTSSGGARFFNQQAWETRGTENYAADDNLDYNTTPTRTGAALIFTLQGNQHTIPVAYNMTASVVPKEIEPLIYPTYSTILSQNACGYRAHPSVWSTITLSREGKKISSTWQSIANSASDGVTYTTSSGDCEIATSSAFPYGARQLNTATIGGNMQPNKKIVVFQKPGVFFTITADAQSTESGFRTVSDWGITNTDASNITLQREIQEIAGVGFWRFNILDNGLP
jgi:hypothetical protein